MSNKNYDKVFEIVVFNDDNLCKIKIMICFIKNIIFFLEVE